jgi:hypothetical protein
MAVRLSVLHAGRPLLPGIFVVLISVIGWFDPRAIVRLEGLGKLKIHQVGTRSRGWKDDIKRDLEEVWYLFVKRSHLAHCVVQWQAPVNFLAQMEGRSWITDGLQTPGDGVCSIVLKALKACLRARGFNAVPSCVLLLLHVAWLLGSAHADSLYLN